MLVELCEEVMLFLFMIKEFLFLTSFKPVLVKHMILLFSRELIKLKTQCFDGSAMCSILLSPCSHSAPTLSMHAGGITPEISLDNMTGIKSLIQRNSVALLESDASIGRQARRFSYFGNYWNQI